MQLRDFWAKLEPFQSVYTHGIVTGIVAKNLFEEYTPTNIKRQMMTVLKFDNDQLGCLVAYLASLHDIGKLELSFQYRDPDTAKKMEEAGIAINIAAIIRTRHEQTGKVMLRRIWNYLNQDEDSADIFSDILAMHHQQKTGIGSHSQNTFFTDIGKEMEEQMREHMFESRMMNLPIVPYSKERKIKERLSSLITLADRIASDTMFADAEEWIDKENYKELICEKAKILLNAKEIEPETLKWPVDICTIWPSAEIEKPEDIEEFDLNLLKVI